jgi:CheY-like chemotaxis protein
VIARLREASGYLRNRKTNMSEVVAMPHDCLVAVHILVVDDNTVVREVLTTVLASYGATVISVGSAAEALRVLPVERPNVLLTDLSMPEADGFSLIRRVRALPPEHGGRTPAAWITGLAAAQDRAEVLRAGFQFCLGKPVNTGELVAAVAILATKECLVPPLTVAGSNGPHGAGRIWSITTSTDAHQRVRRWQTLRGSAHPL